VAVGRVEVLPETGHGVRRENPQPLSRSRNGVGPPGLTGTNPGPVVPAWVYYQAASVLAGTDADSYLRFLEQARRYRQELISYVQSKNGLFSAPYFTRADVNRLLTTAELESLKISQGQRAVDEMIGPGWDGVPALDLRDPPKFELAPEPVVERLRRAVGELGILIFLNLVFFLTAHVAFLKADVRPG